jgi:hypothetical protein
MAMTQVRSAERAAARYGAGVTADPRTEDQLKPEVRHMSVPKVAAVLARAGLIAVRKTLSVPTPTAQ